MSGNRDQFHRAVRVLVGPGAVKQRLIVAYLEHLRAVDSHDLPESVGLEFTELQSAFSCVKAAGGLCAAEVAVRKMSEHEATTHAERIVALFMRLSGVGDDAPDAASAPRLRVVGEDDAVPAFLSRA